MTRTSLVALAFALLVAGCIHGPAPSEYPVAMTPAGARVALRLHGDSRARRGELFAVDTTGVYIRDKRLTRARWRHVFALDVYDRGSEFDVARGAAIDSARLRRLSMVSRFPQGLDGPMLDRVLAALGQPTLLEFR